MVEFVENNHPGEMSFAGEFKRSPRVGLNPCSSINGDDCCFCCTDGGNDLPHEVGITRGVDDIDPHPVMFEVNHRSRDGKVMLSGFIVGIQQTGSVVD